MWTARPSRSRARGSSREPLQHENDHLTGRLLIDMVGPVKRQIIKRKMMRKENEREDEAEAT
jgi:peptide deformylase